MDKLPNWLRWIICAPLAVLTYLIINAINRITFLMVFGDPFGLFFKAGTIFFEGTVAVMASLYTIYIIAPTHKNTAIITASIFIGIVSIIGVTLQIVNPNSITPIWQILFSAIISICSCLYFCINIFKNKNFTIHKETL